MSEVYGAMVQNAPMGHNMRTQIDSVIRDRFPSLSGFKGVNDPEFPQWLAGLKGGDRAKLIKFFDSSVAQELGMPDVSAARFAITNPDLVTSDALSVGYRFGTPAEGAPFRRSTDHPSYGAYVERAPGTTSMTLGGDVPWTIAARDTALPKAAVQGDIRALPKDIKSYMGNPQLRQQIDQQWVDETSRYLELLREQGIDAADVYAQGLLGQFMAR
jgi:hypothetical protein